MTWLSSAVHKLCGAAASISALATFMLILHIVVEVILRFVFNSPIGGTIIFVSYYYMIAICFLSLGASELSKEHVAVDIVYNLLPRGAQRTLDIIVYLISFAVVAVLFFRSASEAITKFQQFSSVFEGGYRIYTWPTYFLLPIGFGLFVLAVLVNFTSMLLHPNKQETAALPEV